MFSKLININIIRFLFLVLSFNNVFLNYAVIGKDFERIQNIDYEKNNSSELEDLIPKYILGPGDQLKITFLGLEDLFSNKYYIDPEGYVFLPEINEYKASGKTVNELKLELEKVYEEYIKDPIIDISIGYYRPVNYYLKGEVKTPGLYNLPIVIDEKNYFFPKLYDALKLGGGLNNNSDVSNIEIIRKNSNSQGGGKIKTSINLLNLFFEGNQDYNIDIYDGDIITIKRSSKAIKEQILAINRTNISPSKINVTITGNAINPGVITLKRGSSLVQAIASSGGKKLYSGDVEFIRFNEDGSTTKNVFRYNTNAEINSNNNPILMDGDLINIKRTFLGGGAELMRDIINPIIFFKGITTIFDD